MHTKTFNAVFKNEFNPVLGLIPRLPYFKSRRTKKIETVNQTIFIHF